LHPFDEILIIGTDNGDASAKLFIRVQRSSEKTAQLSGILITFFQTATSFLAKKSDRSK
jgi:hypothetical protein